MRVYVRMSVRRARPWRKRYRWQFFWGFVGKILQTLHNNTFHWASNCHASFSDIDLTSRSRVRWKGDTTSCIFSMSSFVCLLRTWKTHIPKMQVKTMNSVLGSPWPRRVIIYLGRLTRAGTQNETKPSTLAFSQRLFKWDWSSRLCISGLCRVYTFWIILVTLA